MTQQPKKKPSSRNDRHLPLKEEASKRKVYVILLWIASAVCAGGIVWLSLMSPEMWDTVRGGVLHICEIMANAGEPLQAEAAEAVRTATQPLLWFLSYALLACGVWGALTVADMRPMLAFDVAFMGSGVLAAVFWMTGLGAPYLTAAGLGIVCMLGGIALLWFLSKKLPKIFNYETISYLVFGVLTTLVAYVTFMLFLSMSWGTVWSNTGSWVCAVLFAYVVNRLFVFRSEAHTAAAILREIVLFVAARLLSFGAETALLWVTVDLLHLQPAVCKIAINVLVLILNYVFSKLFVFTKSKVSGDKPV